MGLSWIEMLSAVLFAAVCAMAGALVMMRRMEVICRAERRYGLPGGNASLIGAAVGGVTGMGVAVLGIYYYLVSGDGGGWILWVGRSSYVLILTASAYHVTVLVHTWMRLDAEDRERRGNRRAQEGTLSFRRRKALSQLRQSGYDYGDLRGRDDEAVEELIGVLGERLLTGQRALNRIPFYGYLGTVCGILLMAQHLTRLNEATETFMVLRNMAQGLVLAFQTTLVALLAYLPLRKAFDVLMIRMADLERFWLAWRDEALGGGADR